MERQPATKVNLSKPHHNFHMAYPETLLKDHITSELQVPGRDVGFLVYGLISGPRHTMWSPYSLVFTQSDFTSSAI